MKMRLREESGFALIGALMLALIMLSFGVALASSVDTQQSGSRQERTRESSFNVAEAALNAHALQLARTWATSAVPACNPTATDTKCPEPGAVGGGYSSSDFAGSCPSSPSTPLWQTVVRDNSGTEQYWTTSVNGRAAYDANADNIVWVRSTGFVQCKEVSLVALVSRSVQAMDFPNSVLTANWFETSNQGRKVIIDTQGAYAQPPSIRPGAASQPAGVKVRCSGLTDAQCKNYQSSKGQVQPPAVNTDTGSTSALSSSQLSALERQAKAAGTFWATGSCPTTAAQLTSVSGAPVFVEGPCNISVSGGTINSSASPGALIVKNGTLTLGGSAFFYGLVYMVNQQNTCHPTPILTVEGNATIQGVVAIDGCGGARLGSSKTNLIYDPRAPTLLRGDAGANINKNTFRVLPRGTAQ
jgi:Tfp pilus assembly protein PilX